MRRWVWAWVAFLVVGSSALVARAADRPNIVVFLVDDMGFADCGFNGGKDVRTPNIDALAARGARFGSHYVQPLCSATRASFLTGRLPVHHGIYGALKVESRFGLPLGERTVAEGLKSAGYTTAIVGKWHVGEFEPAYRPTRRGFDHQYGLWYGQIDYFTHRRGGRVDWYRDDRPSADEGYSTQLIGREAARIVEAQPVGTPLFLYVPFNAVHGPFQVPDAYRKPYQTLKPARQTLAAMLSVVDEEVGRVVAAIHTKGLDDSTLFVFSSDNGGVQPGKVTMNTPLRAGKGTTYEGGMRTAAFVTWPGKVEAGRTIDEPVHVVDWYPTFLKLAGAKADQPLPVDGVDLAPLLFEGKSLDRDALLLAGTRPGRAAIRMGDWKLLVRPSEVDAEEAGEARDGTGGEGVELYNLAKDVGEKRDLASKEPERVKAMRARLDEMLEGAAKPPRARAGR